MTRKQQRDRVRLALDIVSGRARMPSLEEYALLGYHAVRGSNGPAPDKLRERAVEILAEAIVPDISEGGS